MCCNRYRHAQAGGQVGKVGKVCLEPGGHCGHCNRAPVATDYGVARLGEAKSQIAWLGLRHDRTCLVAPLIVGPWPTVQVDGAFVFLLVVAPLMLVLRCGGWRKLMSPLHSGARPSFPRSFLVRLPHW